MIRAAYVPGLAMASKELPSRPGVLGLENPEVGRGIRFDRDYTLEEVAELHVATLTAAGPSDDLVVLGYSMGGMILAVIASIFRSKLPPRTRFVFLMTASNTLDFGGCETLQASARAHASAGGSEEEWAVALEPYFSPEWMAAHPERFTAYVRYRAFGLNGQSRESLFRQLFAMKRCPAHQYFQKLDSEEATFVGSKADRIFGPREIELLKRLCPDAHHVVLSRVGHMVHHERPELILRLLVQPDSLGRPGRRTPSALRYSERRERLVTPARAQALRRNGSRQ
jgi:pimeloyl-ACP methyl ester carboxylesterase